MNDRSNSDLNVSQKQGTKQNKIHLPVLVEASTALFAQMFSKDCLECTETLGSFNVPNDTDNNHWWCFENGHSLDDFLLVHLGTRLIDITNNVSHTGFVCDKGGQMDRLGSIVLGEGLYLTTMTLGSLLGSKGHGAMARRRKLAVRLEYREKTKDIKNKYST